MIAPPLSYDEARQAAHMLAQRRSIALDELELAIRSAADKKMEHRKARALAYVQATGGAADQRRAQVEDLASAQEYQRDIAEGMVKVCIERLAACDGERASLHRLMEWAMKDPAGMER